MTAPDPAQFADTVRWQKCPVCDGRGLVSRPPGVAGDQREFMSTSCGPWPCRPCVGTGLLRSTGAEMATDYGKRYNNDPVFHAQVEIVAQAILRRWEARSVLNQSLPETAWAEAKLLAFDVLVAVDAAHLDGQEVAE